MKFKKAIGCLVAFTALVASGITFSGGKPVSADDIPVEEHYVVPAATVTPAYSYSDGPSSEPKYSGSTGYRSTATGSDGIYYYFSENDTTYGRMNAASTWNSYRGEGVKVAVIDTGCYSSHEDFSKTNFSSLSKNIYNGGTSPSDYNDTNGHGTSSVSTIAASINSVGGLGIAPNVELIVLKIDHPTYGMQVSYMNTALQWCIDNDVDVINMSVQGYASSFSYSYTEDFGQVSMSGTSQGTMSSTDVSAKLNACYNAGITVVAAAGNYNSSNRSYPAANDHVIAVASTGLTDANKYKKAGYSNYGDWVDICAPGYIMTPTTSATNSYSVTYGTSFSSPLVAGAIALYKCKYPTATPDQIERALKFTADKLSWSGSGAGAINVGKFLNQAPDYVYVESLSLGESTKTLTVGDTYTLHPTISPSNAANKNIIYESSDPDICDVDSNGVLTAKSVGQDVYIYATSEENSDVYDAFEVNVEASEDTPSSEVYKTVTFTSSSMSTGTQAYNNVSFTNTCDGITTTVQNGNNNNKGWEYVKFGSKNEATTGLLTNTSSIDKKISKIDLTFGAVSNVTSATLYVSSSSSYTSATEISFTPVSGVTSVSIPKPIENGYYKIVFEMSKSSGNGPLSLSKIEYYSSGTSPTPITNYTVTFNANGGTGTMSSSITTGSTYVTPSCGFAKSGYTFSKWALNSSSGTQYSVGSTITNISANITLYAIWSESGQGGGGYYDAVLDSDEGTTLLNRLNGIINNSSVDTDYAWSRFESADEDPSNSNNIITIYAQTSLPKSAHVDHNVGWNREHTFPNSKMSGDADNDNHIIYASDCVINGVRGTYKMGVVETGSVLNDSYGNPTTSRQANSLFDPNNVARGKVARSTMYAAAMYGYTPTDNFESIATMLRWHLNYPVNSFDLGRNEKVYTNQHNRNPFVDHPEYACKIWGNTNDTTRSICNLSGRTLTNLTYTGTPNKTTYEEGESFNPTGLTVTATYSDNSQETVTNSVVWTPNPLTEGTTSVTGSYTYGNNTLSVIVNGLTVESSSSGGDEGESITITRSDFEGTSSYAWYPWSKGNIGGQAYIYATETSKMQFNGSRDGKSFFSSSSLGNIESITVTSNGTYGSWTLKTSNTAYTTSNTSEGTAQTTSDSGNTRTYNISGDYQYFTLNLGGSSASYLDSVTVTFKASSTTPKVNSITIDSSLSLDVYNNKTFTFNPVIDADEGADTTVSWDSSDATVASINSSGTVTALKAGTTTITATCGGKTDTCTVTVTDSTPVAVAGVNLNKSSTSISLGSTETLVATVLPANATNKNVTWTSSAPSRATVSDSGVVTPVAVGSTTITVRTVDGGYTATCTVTITSAPVITYQLEADVSEIPFNSGTNHVASVGVKVYQYTGGVKGSVVSSGNVNVDTSFIGRKAIQYTYNSVEYSTFIKISNHESTCETRDILTGSGFTKSNMPSGWSSSGAASDYAAAHAPYRLKFDGTGDKLFASVNTSASTIIAEIGVKFPSGASNISFTVKAYDENNSQITSISAGTINISGTQNQIVTSSTTLSNPNNVNIRKIEYYFNSGGVNIGVGTGKITVDEMPTFAPLQAKAWATYFINETRTADTCLAEQDSQKLAGLRAKWADLAYEYTEMVGESKDEFCTSSEVTIVAARTHYLYIVSKFGAENLGTDGAFVKDSEDHVLRSKQYNPLTLLNENTSIAIIAVLSLLSVSAVGLYLYTRKRKEE